MEIFLNLVWAVVSLLLVVCWLRSDAPERKKIEWSVVVALVLLIVLLFPAISMTDDLVAMNAPAEVEHMLRRNEAPLSHTTSVIWLIAIAAIMVLGVLSAAPRSAYFSCVGPCAFVAALRAAFVRTLGVRPPPAPAFLAV